MFGRMRILLVLLVALTLAATSVTMAVARGQTRVGDQIVLCAGGAVTTIEVDSSGNPIGPVHLCPDMVLGFFAALDLPQVDLPAIAGFSRLTWQPEASDHRSNGLSAACARDPPPVSF